MTQANGSVGCAAQELRLDARRRSKKTRHRTAQRVQEQRPDEALDRHAQDHRQEEQGPEELVPRSLWLRRTATSRPERELEDGDDDAEEERADDRVDVLLRRRAEDQELAVVLEADPVDREAGQPGGVGEREDRGRQRRSEGEARCRGAARAASSRYGAALDAAGPEADSLTCRSSRSPRRVARSRPLAGAGSDAGVWIDGRLLGGVEPRLQVGLGLGRRPPADPRTSPKGLNRLFGRIGPAAYWPAPFGATQYCSNPTRKFSR